MTYKECYKKAIEESDLPEMRKKFRLIIHDPEGEKAAELYAESCIAELKEELRKTSDAFDDYLKAQCRSVGLTEEEILLPSAHGNDRLRWAALYVVQIANISKENERLRESLQLLYTNVRQMMERYDVPQDYIDSDPVMKLSKEALSQNQKQ